MGGVTVIIQYAETPVAYQIDTDLDYIEARFITSCDAQALPLER